MAKKAAKIELRQELIDAGIVFIYPKPIKAFMYKQKDIKLDTVTVRKALEIAKDEKNSILAYQAPKKPAAPGKDSK